MPFKKSKFPPIAVKWQDMPANEVNIAKIDQNAQKEVDGVGDGGGDVGDVSGDDGGGRVLDVVVRMKRCKSLFSALTNGVVSKSSSGRSGRDKSSR